VTGVSRRLHNEELHNMYASQNDQVTEDETDGLCRNHGRGAKCAQNFGRKTRREDTTRKT
jgi:hypothetical protein